MRGNMRMLNVLIASPSDARSGRDAVQRELKKWNRERAGETGYVLNVQHWKISGVPLSGRGDPQSVINPSLVDEADIVFAVFYHRLGTATGRAVSGTAEEIERSVAAGKFVHVCFLDRLPPFAHDENQFRALRKFREAMDKTGLVFGFNSESKLADIARRSINDDVRTLRMRSQQLSRVGVSGLPFAYTELTFGEETHQPANVSYNHHDDTASVRNTTHLDLVGVLVVAGPAPTEFSVTLAGPDTISGYGAASYQMPPGIRARELFPSPFYVTFTWTSRSGRRFGFQKRFATWM